VQHCHPGGNSLVGVKGHHSGEQVKAKNVQVLSVVREGDSIPLREGGLEIGQLQSIWPVCLIWSSENLEDLKDLIDLRVSHEERAFLSHFGEDASKTPHVDTESILLLT
jgi:hypothetical protein